MKKIILFFCVILMISCKNESKDYVTLKGKLNTSDIEKLTIQSNGFSKEIAVNDDGTFSDTLKVTDGLHALRSGADGTNIFLKNGYDLVLNFKGNKISEGISFEGEGAETNNFMDNQRSFFVGDHGDPKAYFILDKEEYDNKISEAKSMLASYKEKAVDLDSIVEMMYDRNEKMFFGYLDSNYDKMHETLKRLAKGTVSPIFENYENFKGGKTSLSDLKGKYVYIDVWATWCAPCKAEIPYLKELESEFNGKNIEFVSISVDKDNAYETWKQMVKEKELKGVQLFADNNFESDFIVAYGINAIPRFILLDPDGKIVDADVYRPSDPKLKEFLNELGV
ncbi:TlpA disulfide reductase family protein [Lutibacter sp. B1]|uniref:TlpA family protein disulfide reductase n=1 Tax=Lutibacter sp. B1 TaxID=2725996 RepID=UPI0014574683|nr:TlpA disulfide reductase family protein [Lutibacter sp. B1]NLP57532.1 TlpA family protein disulfide reductase [Lutibacter sp. B1]